MTQHPMLRAKRPDRHADRGTRRFTARRARLLWLPALSLLLAGLLGAPAAGAFDRSGAGVAEHPVAEEGGDLGRVAGSGCSAHYEEGQRWPQLVDGVEGVVTCSNDLYYFKPAQPAAPRPRSLGRLVGDGCAAAHEDGESWPQLVDGVEGVVACSNDGYYFKVARRPLSQNNPALNATMLCYYGNRAAASLGVLGQHSLATLERMLREQAKPYAQLNDGAGVTPCFDYIYLVANASAPPYSHLTPRMDLFEEALQYAEDRNILFFVDLQLGYRDLETEVRQVLPLLRKTNVHLALDTEFFMAHRGGVPGDTLGSMDAADINLAQRIMQEYIQEHGLGDRILKVYQFDPIMLTNKGQLKLDTPNVRVLINADGVDYGGTAGKLNDYQQYADERHGALGVKLFFDWDNPLLTPAQIMALEPQPHEVTYQ